MILTPLPAPLTADISGWAIAAVTSAHGPRIIGTIASLAYGLPYLHNYKKPRCFCKQQGFL